MLTATFAVIGIVFCVGCGDAYEYSCRSRCDDDRSKCYDKAVPIIGKSICDNDHKKCVEGCK